MYIPFHAERNASSLSHLTVREPVERRFSSRRKFLKAGVSGALIAGTIPSDLYAAPAFIGQGARIAWGTLRWLSRTIFADYIARKAAPLIDWAIERISDALKRLSRSLSNLRKRKFHRECPPLHAEQLEEYEFALRGQRIPDVPIVPYKDYGVAAGLSRCSISPTPMNNPKAMEHIFKTEWQIEDESAARDASLADQASGSVSDIKVPDRFTAIQVTPYQRPPKNNRGFVNRFNEASRQHTPEGTERFQPSEVKVYGGFMTYEKDEFLLFKVERDKQYHYLSNRLL